MTKLTEYVSGSLISEHNLPITAEFVCGACKAIAARNNATTVDDNAAPLAPPNAAAPPTPNRDTVADVFALVASVPDCKGAQKK